MHPGKTVSFDAARGEILGLAGLVGAGRSEMAKALVGLEPSPARQIILDGQSISINTPRDAIDHGIYLVPENRRTRGPHRRDVCPRKRQPAVVAAAIRAAASSSANASATSPGEQVDSLKVKTPGIESLVLNLSGGNQQKVVLAKWLAMNPRVMILDEPTRGIDVGAKAEIYRLMRALAEQGTVILMISSDMEEVLNVSDRIAVMHEGEITGVLDRADCNEQNVMQLAVGKKISAAKPAYTH